MQVTSQAMNRFAQSRVTVFVGAFGSGKTELALNLAIRLAHAAERPNKHSHSRLCELIHRLRRNSSHSRE